MLQCNSICKIKNLVQVFSKAEECIKVCEAVLHCIRHPSNEGELIKSTVAGLDLVSNNLCSLLDLSEMVLNKSFFREDALYAAINLQKKLYPYMNDLNMDDSLYKAITTCLNVNETKSFLSLEGKKVGEAFKRDFENFGIHLPFDRRSRFSELQSVLHKHGQLFEQANSDARRLHNLLQLLKGRYNLARLLGYRSYSEWFLQDHYLSSPSLVINFLHNSRSVPLSSARSDQLSSHLSLEDIFSILKKFTSEKLKLSFTIDKCHMWGQDCFGLKFLHNNEYYGDLIIHLDERNDGNAPACHFPLLTWRDQFTENIVYGDCRIQRPLSFISLRVNDQRNLLFSEIKSILHEFGHGLHTVFSKTEFHHLSGTRCKLDFAEIPSMIMEQALFDSETFNLPNLPVKFQNSYQDFRDLLNRANNETSCRQTLLGVLDQFLHSDAVQEFDKVPQLLSGIDHFCVKSSISNLDRLSLLSQIPNFTHFNRYGAGYYTYQFSSKISFDIWNNLLNKNSPSYNPNPIMSKIFGSGGSLDTRDILDSLRIQISDS